MSEIDRVPEDDSAAAELALGLLDTEERRAAEQRLIGDDGFRADYRWWSELIARAFAGAAEPPPPSLWLRIADRLPANENRVVPGGMVALRRWRAGALAASAVAAVLGAGLVTSLSRPPRVVRVVERSVVAPPLVAVLTGGEGETITMAISYDPGSARLRVAPGRLKAGEGSLELWVIPADKRPRALGLVDGGAATVLGPPSTSRDFIRPEAVLAISREPKGGSPSGAPTGPVVLKGPVTIL